jgi:hypothetical protein
VRVTRFWRGAVGVRGGLLERRTGGEFWRLVGAAPARRPFYCRLGASGAAEPPAACRQPLAVAPDEVCLGLSLTRFADHFPCGFDRKDERSDCETAGTALPLADSGGRSAAQRRSRLARLDGRNLSPQPPRWACAPPKVCARERTSVKNAFPQIAGKPLLARTPRICLPPLGGTGGHMIAASAPFASCGLTWTQISDAGVAPRAGIGDGDAASAGRSCRGC